MDLRVFFQKVRETEKNISTEHVVVMSLETSDGGRPGQLTEVSRAVAARLIVEGRARLATGEETARYYEAEAVSREDIRQRERAENVKLTVVASELQRDGKTKILLRNPDR